MIVTCQQCATQFHLDDTKVPESGIRVRCSRCKFAFMVESPEQPSADHGASVAQDTLATGAVGMADESESDWEFNEDIEGGGKLSANGLDMPAPDAAAAAVDDLLGSVVPAQQSNADAMSAFEPDSDSEDPFEGADGRDAFGIGNDLSGSDLSESGLETGESVDVAGIDLESESLPGAPDEVHDDLSIGSEAIEGSSETDSLDAGAEDDLGPLPWEESDAEDLFDEAVAEAPGVPTSDIPSLHAIDSEEPSAATESAETDPEVFEVDVEKHAASVWLARTRAGVGWAISATLCAAALYLGLVPKAPVASPESVPLSIAGVDAQAIRGSWIDNASAGPIYVISGSVRAEAPVLPAGVELRVRLLDAHGNPIPAETAAVGPPIPTGLLREGSPRELRDRQERGASPFMRERLAPGERRPFHAVFARMAPAAATFEVLAAESASGPAPDERIVDAAAVDSAIVGP